MAADPKRYGAAVMIRLVGAWVRETRRLSDQVSEYRAENASLKSGKRERKRHAPLVVMSLILGPIIFGIGVDLFRSDHFGAAIALILIAIVFIVLGIYVGAILGVKNERSSKTLTLKFSGSMTEASLTRNASFCVPIGR